MNIYLYTYGCILTIYHAESYSQTSKIELFAQIISGFQPLTVFTKSSMLDV